MLNVWIFFKASVTGAVVICGDANADVRSNRDTKHDFRAKIFHSFLDKNDMCYAPMFVYDYTFKPTSKTLDYVILGKWQTDMILENRVISDECCVV